MGEIKIKRHSFDQAKNRLKEFAEKTEAEIAIDKVSTDGGFLGLGDHKVTGYELNRRLESIQGHLINLNSTNNRTIKEFQEIYNALDALDKEYIASIIASVKAIEKTSNDVRVQQCTLKQHNKELLNQQKKLDVHQMEIDKNVANISKVVIALKSFKEKLDGYKHITDIDKIWSDCKLIQNEIQEVSDSITKLSKKTTNDIETANNQNKAFAEQINKDILTLQHEAESFREFFSDLSTKIENTSEILHNQVSIIQDISNFMHQASNIIHLNDVDAMWEDIRDSKDSFNNIEKELQNIDDDILQMQRHFDDLDAFVTVLNGYTHLHDIDSLWGDLEGIKTEVKEIIKDINDDKEAIQKHQSNLENLNAISVEYKNSINTLSQKQIETEEYTKINRDYITELQDFREKIASIEHIGDVDSMWEQGNTLKNDLTETNNSIVSLQQKTIEIDNEIADKNAKVEGALAALERKLKYTYFIAGGSLGLAIIELIFILVRVI